MTLRIADLRALAEGYDPAPAKSWSLPGRAYTRSDFLEAEREAIFKRSWQLVCHEEKLRQAGDYLAFEIQGQPLLLVRDRDGGLGAFYNVCKHRGHELLSGEGNTTLITCPYHAWTYGLDGRLRAARRSEMIEGYDLSKVCLTALRVEVFCHFVFVNLDPEAEPLAKTSGDLGREITRYAPDLGSLTLAHRETFTIKANWKIVVDNFLECYHCPVAHKAFVDLIDMDNYKVKTHGIYSSHMSRGIAGDNAAYDTSQASVQDHAVWWLWPNLCLLRFPGTGNMMVLNVFPVAPDETYETYDFYFENPVPDEQQREAIAYMRDVLQREDIAIVESVHRGMTTPAFDRGRFVADPEGSGLSEHGVHHFHGLVIEAMARHADRLAAIEASD